MSFRRWTEARRPFPHRDDVFFQPRNGNLKLLVQVDGLRGADFGIVQEPSHLEDLIGIGLSEQSFDDDLSHLISDGLARRVHEMSGVFADRLNNGSGRADDKIHDLADSLKRRLESFRVGLLIRDDAPVKDMIELEPVLPWAFVRPKARCRHRLVKKAGMAVRDSLSVIVQHV